MTANMKVMGKIERVHEKVVLRYSDFSDKDLNLNELIGSKFMGKTIIIEVKEI